MDDDTMPDNVQDALGERELWKREQDELAVETLNALLRAVGDGTVYDMRGTYDDQD